MPDLEELTTHCIRCGFCLETCPTFTQTASELDGPRGRIYLVRSATEGKLRWQEDVKPHLDRCLGCLACETACPSGVHYGAILELARDKIEQEQPKKSKAMLLASTTNPKQLRAQLNLARLLPGKRLPGPLSRILTGQAAEADLPSPQTGTLGEQDRPSNSEPLVMPVRGEVYLLEGCAMRVLYPRVHLATRRLLRRVGYTVREVEQGCCGALHAHNGYLGEAKSMAASLMAQMPLDLPVIVNSAGCGSTMKHYDELIPSQATNEYSSRVADLTEFLLSQGLAELLNRSHGLPNRVTYHDACHLAHGQKIRSQPRDLLKAIPGIDYVELIEADTCCGSAGIYNVTQPKLARELIERKYRHIEASGATLVATGNPGCHAWIAQAAREHGHHVRVLHTAELLEASFSGLPID